MQDKLTEIFKKAKYESDTDLVSGIWLTITMREKRMTQYKLWTFALTGFASLGGLVPALKILLGDFTRSGFYEYFSLIFSDNGSVLSYWKEFIFSLAESLPVMSIIFTLSLVFIFFLSIRYTLKQINNNSSTGIAYGVA